MKTDNEQRAMLARMERGRAETERHLAIIERQIAGRAERIAMNAHVQTRRFARATARWNPADERRYQETLATLRFARRAEIEALARKLARQAGAIAAFRLRHGINAGVEEIAS